MNERTAIKKGVNRRKPVLVVMAMLAGAVFLGIGGAIPGIRALLEGATSGAGVATILPIEQTELNLPYSGTLSGELTVGAKQKEPVFDREKLDVLAGKTIAQISSGNAQTCVLTEDNEIYCWGMGTKGQGGNGTTKHSYVPAAVDMSGELAGKQISQISVGYYTVCALDSDGLAYCWGDGGVYQAGNGRKGTWTTPVATTMPVGVSFSQISVGQGQVCALATTGMVYCWGTYGMTDSVALRIGMTPVPTGLSGIQRISVGDTQTCALAMDGTLYCWGSNNTYGQLGNATTIVSRIPVAVSKNSAILGKTIVQIESSANHACALDDDGQAYCWGWNNYGQIGNETITNWSTPMAVAMPEGVSFTQISTGHNFNCALGSDENAYCWGYGASHLLGTASTANQNKPVMVDNTTALAGLRLTRISVGDAHTCGVASDDNVYCWGTDTYGQLGDGNDTDTTHQDTIVEVASVKSAVDMDTVQPLRAEAVMFESYGATNCAVKEGKAYCWGWNNSGQIGNGTTANSSVAVAVDTSGVLKDKIIVSMAGGDEHTCALDSEGQIYCWGANDYGQLGNGESEIEYVLWPVAVDMSSIDGRVTDINAGHQFTCALTDGGMLYCWGNAGVEGRTGLGVVDSDVVTTPRLVGGDIAGKKIVRFALGSTGGSAVDETGQVYCWGWNYYNQTSPEDIVNVMAPKAIDMAPFGGVAVRETASAHAATCAVTVEGKVYCWGNNTNGELGRGEEHAEAKDSTAAPIAMGDMGEDLVVEQLTGGYEGFCVLASDARVYCWGWNVFGSLTGTAEDVSVKKAPILMGAREDSAIKDKDITTVRTSIYATCVVDTEQYVYCWGMHLYGEIGNGVHASNIDLSLAAPTYVLGGVYAPETTTKTLVLDDELGVEVGQYQELLIEQTVGRETFPAEKYPDTVGRVDYYLREKVGGVCDVAGANVAGVAAPVVSLVANADAAIRVDISGLSTDSSWCVVAEYEDVGDLVTDVTASYLSVADMVPGEISGRVYIDMNTNGLYEAGDEEVGIAGVGVTLVGTSNSGEAVEWMTLTDAEGVYSFENVAPGVYSLSENQPAKYANTASAAGYLTDADGETVETERVGKGSLQLAEGADANEIVGIELRAGEHSQNNLFGEVCGKIGNYVWYDEDGDGYADAEESGIAGVEMVLYSDVDENWHLNESIDEIIGITYTDEEGNYMFETVDLNFGSTYRVDPRDSDGVLVAMGLTQSFAGNVDDYTLDNYSSNLRGFRCYGSAVELVLNLERPVEPELRTRSLSRAAVSVLAGETTGVSVSPAVNMTADFGFTVVLTAAGDAVSVGASGTPSTGWQQTVQDVVAPVGVLGLAVAGGLTVFGVVRWRRKR